MNGFVGPDASYRTKKGILTSSIWFKKKNFLQKNFLQSLTAEKS